MFVSCAITIPAYSIIDHGVKQGGNVSLVLLNICVYEPGTVEKVRRLNFISVLTDIKSSAFYIIYAVLMIYVLCQCTTVLFKYLLLKC